MSVSQISKEKYHNLLEFCKHVSNFSSEFIIELTSGKKGIGKLIDL